MPFTLLAGLCLTKYQTFAADEAPAEQTPAKFKCAGSVIDAFFGKPVAGAKVTILKLASPQRHVNGDGKILAQFEAVTDAEGKYSFTLPNDHPFAPSPGSAPRQEVPYIPLEIAVKHPDYAPRVDTSKIYVQLYYGRHVTDQGFSLPAENVDPSQRSSGTVELRPGKSVTGTLLSPDGKPLSGIKMRAHSEVPRNERFGVTRDRPPAFSDDETRTDAAGRFRVMMITPGEGTLAIYPEKDYAPLVKPVYDQRGEIGNIRLARGQSILGRVSDSEGKPLAGLFACAGPWDLLGSNSSYSDRSPRIRRAAESDSHGNFTIAALPAGEYYVELRPYFDDPTKNPHDLPDLRPMSGIFLPRKVIIVEGKSPERLEIRPMETVEIAGRVIAENDAGNFPFGSDQSLRARSQLTVAGNFNDMPFQRQLEADDDGNFQISVPKGLNDTTIENIRLNGGIAGNPRVRIGDGQEFVAQNRRIGLGTLKDDLRNIEIDFTRNAAGGLGGGFGGGRAAGAGAARAGRAAANPAQAAFGGGGGRRANPRGAAQRPGGNDAANKEQEKPKEVTGTGSVIDADTGQPISGAKVRIWQNVFNAKDGTYKYIRHVDSVTDADGKYAFTFSTDQVETLSNGATIIRVEPEVKHTDYVAPSQLRRSVYDLITVNGFPPLPGMSSARRATFENRELQPIEMIPAQEATGVLQSPEGKPAAGVRVFANPTAPIGQLARVRLQNGGAPSAAAEQFLNENRQTLDNQPYGADDTVTDADGRFRFLLPTSGECKLAVWPRKEFVPVEFEIHEKRGDLGAFKLQRGPTMHGRILDVDGKPLAGIYLAAERVDAEGKPTAMNLWRAAMSDSDGKFEFAPLPPGGYRVEPRDVASDLTTEHRREPPPEKHPLPGFFGALKVTLADGQEPKALEVRARPTVEISGQATVPNNLLGAVSVSRPRTATALLSAVRGTGNFPLEQNNQPAVEKDESSSRAAAIRQLAPSIRGKFNGFSFDASGEMDQAGHFTIKVPQRLTEAVVVLRTAFAGAANPNQGGSGSLLSGAVNTIAPQWRADKSKPLVTGTEIPLGDVRSGVSGIEIVYSEEQPTIARGQRSSSAARRGTAAPPSE